jgi:hypothetical protein
MKTVKLVAALVALVSPLLPREASAQMTRINVRVISHDAKIIGDGVGGARVVVRDPSTGRVLAEGIQRGGTGDTESIVREPHARGQAVYEAPGAAVFTAEFELDAPTVLEFIGEGPLGYEHAMQRAVKRMLVVPGEDILGDGVLLEVHGFIVELIEPESPAAGGTVTVTARVRMLCGCPHTPGGLWDAARISVKARLYEGSRVIREATLEYSGEPNMFTGAISLQDAGPNARLVVLANDADRANFGMSMGTRVGNRP